jgi:hypothetical protein
MARAIAPNQKAARVGRTPRVRREEEDDDENGCPDAAQPPALVVDVPLHPNDEAVREEDTGRRRQWRCRCGDSHSERRERPM